MQLIVSISSADAVRFAKIILFHGISTNPQAKGNKTATKCEQILQSWSELLVQFFHETVRINRFKIIYKHN